MIERIRKLAILAGVMLVAALGSCRTNSQQVKSALVPSTKGWELYSWPGEQRGVWNFALLEGTNRVKSADEIRAAPEQVRGLNALLGEIERLPPGEFIYWCAPRAPGQPATAHDFPLPPREYLDAASERAQQRRLVLALP